MRTVVFDFESEEIEPMPKYPPKPVGLAIMVDDRPLLEDYYNAWGHPTENNSYERNIKELVADLLRQEDTFWIAHNLAFDAAIIEVKWGLTFPFAADRCADTMLMAFMDDPYGQLSLKPLAEKHLGVPPTERDAVRDWLVAHGICRAGDKNWGAYISKAPGKLVGAYAHGDITRTKGLYEYYKGKRA